MTPLETAVLAYMDAHQQELYELLSALVQINTENFITHGNENAGQEYLARVCRELGLETDLFAPDDVPGLVMSEGYNPGRGTDRRQNLVAVYKGRTDRNGVMLAAHMDTVSLGDPAQWSDPPLSGLIRDGKIYGRGAGDDKSGLAAAWFVIKTLKSCGFVPEQDLLLGSYVDEESGGGNGALGLCMKYPSVCYVNLDSSGFEKTSLGGGCFTIRVASTVTDRGIASMMTVFDGLAALIKGLKTLQGGLTRVRVTNFSAGQGSEKAGVINFAIYTDKSLDETERRLQEIFDGARQELGALQLASEGFRRVTRFFYYGETAPESREAAALTEAIFDVTGVLPDTSASNLSDLSIFMRFGSHNSFNFGVPNGSAEGGGAHQPNEHVSCKNLLEHAKSLALMLLRV